MEGELGKVFVALHYWPRGPRDVVKYLDFDWVLRNFRDHELIFTTVYPESADHVRTFKETAENVYLPRCRANNLEAQMLMPEGANYLEAVLLLLTRHKMRKLVLPRAWGLSSITNVLDKHPNLWCKVWIVTYDGGQESVSELGANYLQMYLNAIKEAENLKRIADEEAIKSKKIANEEAEKLKKTADEEAEKSKRIASEEAEKFKKIADEETIRRKTIEKQLQMMTTRFEEMSRQTEKFKKIADEETTKRKNLEEKLRMMDERSAFVNKSLVPTTTFPFKELQQATQNFSDLLKIGEGGLGSVYKGVFRGTTVAIKKFKSQNKEDMSNFHEEVVLLSTIRHPNLVTLIGACSEPPILVYEYLSKGSLREYLTYASNTTPRALLPWQVRTRIISEICLALIFLHSNKPEPVIHGDLRPENIFLDANFTSKLSDFGKIKQVETSWTKDRRRLAYIDPESLDAEEITSESDVYSFGVIILNLITGKSQQNNRRTVQQSMKTNTLSTLIDVSAGDWPFDQAEEMANIGMRCADVSGSKRPKLVEEVWPTIERLMKLADETK